MLNVYLWIITFFFLHESIIEAWVSTILQAATFDLVIVGINNLNDYELQPSMCI